MLSLLIILDYESLHTNAGILQGDISTGNLMINEGENDSSWPAFLIDLDLAIRDERSMRREQEAKRARGLSWLLDSF